MEAMDPMQLAHDIFHFGIFLIGAIQAHKASFIFHNFAILNEAMFIAAVNSNSLANTYDRIIN